MPQIALADESWINPLDVVERLAAGHDWSFERASDDEITILVTGKWTDYQVSYTWMGDIEALHLACAFDLRVPERRRGEVQALISLINERLWVGHFDLWTNEGILMFRHALVLAGGTEASGKQCEAVLGSEGRLGLVTEDIPARRQLGKHDQVCPIGRRRRRPEHRLRAVLLELADMRLVLGDSDADGAAHTLTVAQPACPQDAAECPPRHRRESRAAGCRTGPRPHPRRCSPPRAHR